MDTNINEINQLRRKEILENIKKFYEEYDQKLYEEWKQSGDKSMKVTAYKNKCILTLYGPVIFKRRVYLVKQTKKCFYLLDEKLNLKQKARNSKRASPISIDPELEENIADMLINYKVSQKIVLEKYPRIEGNKGLGQVSLSKILKKKKMSNESITK